MTIRELLWNEFKINIPRELIEIIEEYMLPSIINHIYCGPCKEILVVDEKQIGFSDEKQIGFSDEKQIGFSDEKQIGFSDEKNSWISYGDHSVALHRNGRYHDIVKGDINKNISGLVNSPNGIFAMWANRWVYICDIKYPNYPIQILEHNSYVQGVVYGKEWITSELGVVHIWRVNKSVIKISLPSANMIIKNLTYLEATDQLFGLDSKGDLYQIFIDKKMVQRCPTQHGGYSDILSINNDKTLVRVSLNGTLTIGEKEPYKLGFGPILGLCKTENPDIFLFWTSSCNIYCYDGFSCKLLIHTNMDGMTYDVSRKNILTWYGHISETWNNCKKIHTYNWANPIDFIACDEKVIMTCLNGSVYTLNEFSQPTKLYRTISVRCVSVSANIIAIGVGNEVIVYPNFIFRGHANNINKISIDHERGLITSYSSDKCCSYIATTGELVDFIPHSPKKSNIIIFGCEGTKFIIEKNNWIRLNKGKNVGFTTLDSANIIQLQDGTIVEKSPDFARIWC